MPAFGMCLPDVLKHPPGVACNLHGVVGLMGLTLQYELLHTPELAETPTPVIVTSVGPSLSHHVGGRQ